MGLITRTKKVDLVKVARIYEEIYVTANIIYIESIMLSDKEYINVAEVIRCQISDFFLKLEKTNDANRAVSGLSNIREILNGMRQSLFAKEILNNDYIRIRRHVLELETLIHELVSLHLKTSVTTQPFYGPV